MLNPFRLQTALKDMLRSFSIQINHFTFLHQKRTKTSYSNGGGCVQEPTFEKKLSIYQLKSLNSEHYIWTCHIMLCLNMRMDVGQIQTVLKKYNKRTALLLITSKRETPELVGGVFFFFLPNANKSVIHRY